MNSVEVEKDSTYFLEILVTDTDGSPITGLSLTFAIYKSSTNGLVTSGSLTDVGNGIYQASYAFTELGQFRVLYTTPTNYTDEVEGVLVVDKEANIDSILSKVCDIFDCTVLDVEKTFSYDAEGRVSTVDMKFGDFVTPTKTLRVTFTYNVDNTVDTLTIEEI